MKRRCSWVSGSLQVTSVVLILLSFGLVTALLGRDAAQPKERPALVLIHGVRNDASIWESKGYLNQLNADSEFYSAGELRLDRPTVLAMKEVTAGIPVIGLSLRDRGQVDIRESGRDLGRALASLRDQYQFDGFWLVCKSLGGVVAREYVTSENYARDVERLITISSPHLGSELAHLPDLYRQLKVCSARWVTHGKRSTGGWAEQIEGYVAGELGHLGEGAATRVHQLAAKAGWDLEAPALGMLLPPEGDNYMAELNRRPHPRAIRFTSVIAAKHVGNYDWADLKLDCSRFREGQLRKIQLLPVVNDLCRATLSICSKGTDVHRDLLWGDGAVSVWSQDLNNVEAFAKDPRLNAEVIRLAAGHHQVHEMLNLPYLLVPKPGHETGPGE